MKRILSLFAAFAMTIAPSAALANSATIRLVLTVPVQCSVDLVGGAIEGNRLVMQVHRNCNTGHDVIVSGQPGEALGAVTVHYNDGSDMLTGSEIVLPQTERYYNQTDTVVVETSGGDVEDMQRLAASLQVSVVVA